MGGGGDQPGRVVSAAASGAGVNEMVDRGAKALCERFTKADTWDRLDERGRNLWREMFRVAIAAMREPTESMCVAATAAESLDPGEGWADFNVKGAWQAMIDAALK